jgi:hypothetical protein
MWYSPQMRITTLLRLGFFALAACSNSSGSDAGVDGDTGEDTGPPRDPNKNCVKPGTKNNELGVGGYCDPKDDAGNFKNPPDCLPIPDGDGGMLSSFCTANYAPPDLWFCTRPCEKGNDVICGTGSYCDCQGNQCGCIPNVCGNPPDAGPKDSGADSPTDGPSGG